ncbi:alpha/beta hydrolase, partial [Rhizobium johnstonii]
MSEQINHHRRRFFGMTAIALAAVEFGVAGTAAAQSSATAASVPAIKPGTNTSFEALKQVKAGVLDIGYAEAGKADAPVVLLLHGWP